MGVGVDMVLVSPCPRCHALKWFGVRTWIKFQIKKGFQIRKVQVQIRSSMFSKPLLSLNSFNSFSNHIINQIPGLYSLNGSRIFLKSHTQAVCWNNPLFPFAQPIPIKFFNFSTQNYSISLPKLCQHSISTSRQTRMSSSHMLKQDNY